MSQRVLPALAAREEIAKRQVAARRAWFAGTGTLVEAFPDLDGARLGSTSVIDGRLAALDEGAADRAGERVAVLPALGSPTRQRTLTEALGEALDAEDAAADLERRLFVGLRAFHRDHPELSDEGTARLRGALEEAWRVADDAARTGPEEARPSAALQAAALDEERMRLDRLVHALRRRATVAEAPAPSPDDDLVRLGDPAQAPWAAERLRLVAPFLDEATAARVEAEIAPVLVAEPTPAAVEPVSTAVDRAREEATQAAAELERARAGALAERDVRLAEIRESAAEAHRRRTERWEEVRGLIDANATRRADLEAAFGVATRRAGSVKARLGFGQDEVDEAYSEVRSLVGTLRTETGAAEAEYVLRDQERRAVAADTSAERALVRAARWEVRAEGDLAVRASRDEALSRWEAALDDELRAAVRGVIAARDHRDAVARLLLDARRLRRALRSEASVREWERDRAVLGTELAAEVRLLGPSTGAGLRDRARGLRGLPAALLDANVVMSFLRGSVLTILVAIVWWLLRGRTHAFAGWAIDRLRAASPGLRVADIDPVHPPLERLIRATLDWFLGSLLVEPVGALVPEMGFLLRAWTFVAAWRVAVSLYELLFVRHPDTRLGLFALHAKSWDLGQRTVRWVAAWAATRGFTRYVLFHVLGVDVLDRTTRIAMDVFGVVVLAYLLHQWEPHLRRRMERLGQGTGVAAVLAAGPPAAVLRAPWAAADAAYLLAGFLWMVLNRFGGRRERIGQILNVLTRYRLKSDAAATAVRSPCPSELRAAIEAERPTADTRLERPEVDGALWSAWISWEGHRRQGLVGVVGDRGMGKRTVFDHFEQRLAATTDLPVVRRRVAGRLTTEAGALAWMRDAWGLPAAADTVDAVATALQALPPRVLIVEGLEIAFLRTVNGFQALRTILYTASAASRRHCFVFGIHHPAWRYLSSLGDVVNTALFGTVIQIRRMGEDELHQIALSRLEAAGWRPDFQGLVRSSPFGGDPEVEVDRATTTFFRLLAEASAGNPAIALDMFAQCLSPSSSPGVVEVYMARALELDVVEGLTSGDLFTLVALRTQEALHLDEIVAVTSLGPTEVKTTVKHLEQRGLVAVVEDWVRIHEAEIAAVTRTLRRRQFIQG